MMSANNFNFQFQTYNCCIFTYSKCIIGYSFDKATMSSLSPYIIKYEVHNINSIEHTIYIVNIENCVLSDNTLINLRHYYLKTLSYSNTPENLKLIISKLLIHNSKLHYNVFDEVTVSNVKTYFKLSIHECNESFLLNENGFIYGEVIGTELPSLLNLINCRLFNFNNPTDERLKKLRYGENAFSPLVKKHIMQSIDKHNYLILNKNVFNSDSLSKNITSDYVLLIALLKKEELLLNKIRQIL